MHPFRIFLASYGPWIDTSNCVWYQAGTNTETAWSYMYVDKWWTSGQVTRSPVTWPARSIDDPLPPGHRNFCSLDDLNNSDSKQLEVQPEKFFHSPNH